VRCRYKNEKYDEMQKETDREEERACKNA